MEEIVITFSLARRRMNDYTDITGPVYGEESKGVRNG